MLAQYARVLKHGHHFVLFFLHSGFRSALSLLLERTNQLVSQLTQTVQLSHVFPRTEILPFFDFSALLLHLTLFGQVRLLFFASLGV